MFALINQTSVGPKDGFPKVNLNSCYLRKNKIILMEIGRSFHFVPAEFLILLAKIGAISHLSIMLLSILPES